MLYKLKVLSKRTIQQQQGPGPLSELLHLVPKEVEIFPDLFSKEWNQFRMELILPGSDMGTDSDQVFGIPGEALLSHVGTEIYFHGKIR